jgi:hypothetical protein
VERRVKKRRHEELRGMLGEEGRDIIKGREEVRERLEGLGKEFVNRFFVLV